MFLKIMSRDDDIIHTGLYEGHCILINKSKDGLLFTIENSSNPNAINIAVNGDKPRDIFIISDKGKTVDRIFWNQNK